MNIINNNDGDLPGRERPVRRDLDAEAPGLGPLLGGQAEIQ